MDRPDRRVGERDREVVGFLQAERDLSSALPPRSDLGEPERDESAPVELATAVKITHSDADMVDHNPAPRHVLNCTSLCPPPSSHEERLSPTSAQQTPFHRSCRRSRVPTRRSFTEGSS